jgi:hypothetical protein
MKARGSVSQDGSFQGSLTEFVAGVGGLLNGTAEAKGYAKNGSGRALLDFVAEHAPGHAIGEIIYKVVRWQRKGNPEDLLKVAAWAFLEWDRARRSALVRSAAERLE